MFLFLLLRRLSPRGRRTVGLGLMATGLALVAVSATLAAGLLVHGIVIAVAGAVALASGLSSGRRARSGLQGTTDDGPRPAGQAARP